MRSDVRATLTLAAVAWGAMAFGAVYPWAYRPLIVAAVALGATGIRRRALGRTQRLLAAALVIALGAAALQLVPLPAPLLTRLSPSADEFLRTNDVAYALARRYGFEASHALSIRPASTILGLVLGGSFALLLIGTWQQLTTARAIRLASGIAAIGTLIAVAGIIQRATFNGKIYGFWQPLSPGTEPFGPFVNKNHFAGWMLMAIPLTIGQFCGYLARGMDHVRPDWRSRIVWFSSREANTAILLAFAILLMTLALVLTTSRAGVLCLAIAVAITSRFAVSGGIPARRRALMLGSLGAVAIFMVWFATEAIAARFTNEAFFGIRQGAWQDAVAILNRFWLTGTGLNTYGAATLLYQRHDLLHHYAEAHCDFLQMAVEGGLLAGLPALFALVVFIGAVIVAAKAPSGNAIFDWTRRGAAAGLLAIALQETVDFSLQMPGNAFLFVILAAIAVSAPPPAVRASRGDPSR
jgi:hypothetical protein